MARRCDQVSNVRFLDGCTDVSAAPCTFVSLDSLDWPTGVLLSKSSYHSSSLNSAAEPRPMPLAHSAGGIEYCQRWYMQIDSDVIT